MIKIKKNHLLALLILSAGIYLSFLAYFFLIVRTDGPNLNLENEPSLDCGQWATLRTCELLGYNVPVRYVLDLLPSGIKGNNLKEISDLLKSFGFEAKGFKDSFQGFKNDYNIKIAQLANPDHFIVVTLCKDDLVYFFDGQGRRRVISEIEFKD